MDKKPQIPDPVLNTNTDKWRAKYGDYMSPCKCGNTKFVLVPNENFNNLLFWCKCPTYPIHSPPGLLEYCIEDDKRWEDYLPYLKEWMKSDEHKEFLREFEFEIEEETIKSMSNEELKYFYGKGNSNNEEDNSTILDRFVKWLRNQAKSIIQR